MLHNSFVGAHILQSRKGSARQNLLIAQLLFPDDLSRLLALIIVTALDACHRSLREAISDEYIIDELRIRRKSFKDGFNLFLRTRHAYILPHYATHLKGARQVKKHFFKKRKVADCLPDYLRFLFISKCRGFKPFASKSFTNS